VDFQKSVFQDQRITIPLTAKVIVVSDMFVSDYVGGAELTTQALIDSSPFEVFKLHSKDVTLELLQAGVGLFWIFGNFSQLNFQLIPSIVGNLKYSIVEYDFKYCKFRSPEKHLHATCLPCDCSNDITGKIISTFFYGSMGNWWMSEKQKERYLTTFPFLVNKSNTVLSSVFDDRTLGYLKALRTKDQDTPRSGWIVLGSDSWIKGSDDAKRWCADNGKQFEVVWNLPYDQVLEKLAQAEGFVYLPKGGDTCPRMVIEAKLLGCKLQLNEHVMHKDEEWFATDDVEAIEGYLFVARQHFWNGIKSMMDYRPKISGYTTTYNAVKQQYPYLRCIESMGEFCDEICIVDGGSTDGTWEALQFLESSDPRIKVKQVKRDWSSKRHPIFDGMQKAEARRMCTGDFCWQMDADEVVHPDDAKKIHGLCRAIPVGVDIMSLPVIEGWGGWDKIRCDVNPAKWRLSRNAPHITHGIPASLRRADADGLLYAAEGTDGCDMIHVDTFEPLGHVSFNAPEVDNVRRMALLGNEQARLQYQQWFNQVINGLPCVFHYSWIDLKRKITLYRDYWQNHWRALYNQDTADTGANNYMFGVPWADVTDAMIDAKAADMKAKLGGWVWHRPWDGQTTTPHITINRTPPEELP